LLEEVGYWRPESFLHYVEDYIVSLNALAREVSEDFNELDPILASYAEKIFEITSNVINIVKTVCNKRIPCSKIKKPSDIYELIEIGKEFLERAFNLTIGANPYTFFVWSLRKITRVYLIEHYPKLGDEENFESISRLLGLETILEPPKIKPRGLFKDYILYGYPDFKVEGETPKQRTFGGLICELNDLIWKLSRDDGIRSYNIFYQKIDLYESYKKMANELLESSGWKSDVHLDFTKASFSIEGLVVDITYLKYSISTVGSSIRKRLLHHLSSRMSLFNFLDTIMPPQILGLWELQIRPDKKNGEILKRDWWYFEEMSIS